MVLQDRPDTATLALCRAVDPGRFRQGEPTVDAEHRAKLIELMCPCRDPLAQAEEPIRKRLAFVRAYRLNADRRGLRWITQNAPRVGRCSGIEDPNESHRIAWSMPTKKTFA